jgi:hypothetical protein
MQKLPYPAALGRPSAGKVAKSPSPYLSALRVKPRPSELVFTHICYWVLRKKEKV